MPRPSDNFSELPEVRAVDTRMAESLSAVQRAKIRRLSAPVEVAPEDEGGELNVVPFLDIITNVLMFVLATVSITFTATVDSTPPRGSVRPAEQRSLGLTVLVVPEGFGVKARGGNVGTGCTDTGAGLAVPKRGAAYDYDALKACAVKLKGSAATFADERDVTISANAQVPYDVVIATLDAMRNTDDGDELFPTVSFGVVR
jgi:biopolymer transport protein TolR